MLLHVFTLSLDGYCNILAKLPINVNCHPSYIQDIMEQFKMECAEKNENTINHIHHVYQTQHLLKIKMKHFKKDKNMISNTQLKSNKSNLSLSFKYNELRRN